ncbi:MAG: hypothetical protein BWY65_00554 [Firmicutes bacterium ADurb.Bin373]|nr:MAG: hypothetical protein BWY65_00554 [Firmicutes bacterium ADurb.Bin373]
MISICEKINIRSFFLKKIYSYYYRFAAINLLIFLPVMQKVGRDKYIPRDTSGRDNNRALHTGNFGVNLYERRLVVNTIGDSSRDHFLAG